MKNFQAINLSLIKSEKMIINMKINTKDISNTNSLNSKFEEKMIY